MDNSKFIYTDSNLYNEHGGAVMMEWERGWMERSAEIVCKNGGDILNIGHGLGLVDSYINQFLMNYNSTSTSHTIIENHPDVHIYMKKHGWYDKANVIESDWRTTLTHLPIFDGIYYDTWSGEVNDFYNGLLNHLPYILKKNGIFLFWYDANIELPELNEWCSLNNFSIVYEEFDIDIPNRQHKNGEHYINPKLKSVLLPIITNLNEPKQYKPILI
jgi:hypothetical protein